MDARVSSGSKQRHSSRQWPASHDFRSTGDRCDQNMWRHVAPAFEGECRTVLFDQVGAGGSDPSAYNSKKYGSLSG